MSFGKLLKPRCEPQNQYPIFTPWTPRFVGFVFDDARHLGRLGLGLADARSIGVAFLVGGKGVMVMWGMCGGVVRGNDVGVGEGGGKG